MQKEIISPVWCRLDPDKHEGVWFESSLKKALKPFPRDLEIDEKISLAVHCALCKLLCIPQPGFSGYLPWLFFRQIKKGKFILPLLLLSCSSLRCCCAFSINSIHRRRREEVFRLKFSTALICSTPSRLLNANMRQGFSVSYVFIFQSRCYCPPWHFPFFSRFFIFRRNLCLFFPVSSLEI